MLTDLRTPLSSPTSSFLPGAFLDLGEANVGMFGLETLWILLSGMGFTSLEGIRSADCVVEEDAEGILEASKGTDGLRSFEIGS